MEVMADEPKEFSNDVHGPENAVSVGLQPDGARLKLQARNGYGWRRNDRFGQPYDDEGLKGKNIKLHDCRSYLFT